MINEKGSMTTHQPEPRYDRYTHTANRITTAENTAQMYGIRRKKNYLPIKRISLIRFVSVWLHRISCLRLTFVLTQS